MAIHKIYARWTLILLAVEVAIALWVHDKWIRPFVGDVLVIGLLYCFLKSFFPWPPASTAAGVLFFAFAIEFLQYFKLVERLGLSSNAFARTIIGTSFETTDFLAYFLGFLLVRLAEWLRNKT